MYIPSRKSGERHSRWLLASLPLSLVMLQACDSSTKDPVVEPPAQIYSDEFLEQFVDPLADGFGTDVAYFRTLSFDNSSGSSSASVSDGAIVLRAESDGVGQANRYMRLGNGFREVMVSAEFDPQTSFPVGSNSFASIGVAADLYNTLADNGVGGENPFVGNVNLDFRVTISGSGESASQMCLGSYGLDDYVPVGFMDDGSNCWLAPSSLQLKEGDSFTYGYEFDFTNRTLSVHFNEDRLTIELPGNVFAAYGNTEAGMQVIQENGVGTAVARITNLQLDEKTYDFSVNHILLDQIEIQSDGGSDALQPSVVDGQLQFSIASDNGNYQEQSLQHLQPSDYLETIITLSGKSLIESGRVQGRLESVLYSDVAADERDGRTGDVRASIELDARADGTRQAEICLARSNDPQFDDSQGLLDDGDRRCLSLPMKVELDTPYRVSIALDQFSSNVVFRINGIVVIEKVASSIYDASEASARIVASADGGASALVFVDDVRTAPMALTNAEVQMGLEDVPLFPAPQISPPANSDVPPVFNHAQSLDFIDDFSVDSRQFGFNENTDRGLSGVGYSMGGIELRTAVDSEFAERGSYSELYVNGDTQGIKASVSLSSDSSLPEDPEARALIRVQGHLMRDNQDFEPNDRTGDIYSSIEFSVRGDGRRRVSYYVSRRIEGMDDERLNILDGENGGSFDELIPSLDTVYELGMRLDKERNMLIFSVDDLVREFVLPWQAFPAARNDVIVQVQHSGSSGRAVGKLYSVETDSVNENFIASLPLMGPYRPAFNARFQSQSVQVSDGQLKLTSDARIADSRPARLVAQGKSGYVGAALMLSSESVISADDSGEGRIAGRIGGLMYRAQSVEDLNDSTGKVYASVSLVATSSGEMFADYCAFQSSDSNFENSLELIGGDTENCRRFDTAVLLDTEYSVNVSFNEATKSLIFSIGSEQVEYDIRGDILAVEDGFQGPQARASGLSQAVVFVDELSFSPTPVPLAESTQRLAIDDTL